MALKTSKNWTYIVQEEENDFKEKKRDFGVNKKLKKLKHKKNEKKRKI